MDVILKPGDIFLTRGPGLFSRLIRFCSCSIGECRAKVNHVGVVVKEGTLRTAEIVESVAVARRCRLWEHYGPASKNAVAVFRPEPDPEQVDVVVATAERRWERSTASASSWPISWTGCSGRLRVPTAGEQRRLSHLLLAGRHAFAEAGKNFGVEPGAAERTTSGTFVTANRDRYERIHPLEPLREDEAGQGEELREFGRGQGGGSGRVRERVLRFWPARIMREDRRLFASRMRSMLVR